MAMEMSSNRPISRWMVYISSSAWVGCCPAPSPALMIGTLETAAARSLAPLSKWRMTMTSAYPAITRIVSSMVSPLAAEENSRAFSVVSTPPPRRVIADSNERRVRVLGS